MPSNNTMHSIAFLLPTLLLLVIFPLASANVEKTIFLGPPPPPLSPSLSSSTNPFNPDLSDLGLDRLSPPTPILRTKLNASFPDTNTDADASASPGGKGTESWFLLEGLVPGQRYEVRVCWAATQPTSFDLETYTLPATIDDPSLLSSISRFSSARLESADNVAIPPVRNRRGSKKHEPTGQEASESVLFLRILAAADYYTTNKELMENVPPVVVDLILDPFLGNVFPRSLVPTACWGVVIGIVAVVLAKWIVGEIGKVVVKGVRDDANTANAEKKRR